MQMVFLFLGGLGGWEVFLILAALVLLFGAKKIPELARGMGRGIREFKDATNEIKDEIDFNKDDRNRKQGPSASAHTHADQANTGSTQTEKTAS